MRWTPGGSDADLEDDRASTGGGGGGGGFGGGGRLGIGGFVVVLLLSLVFHKNFFALLGGGSAGAPAAAPAGPSAPVSESPEEAKQVEFVKFVMNSVQDYWAKTFAQNGKTYRHAKLVLFRDAINSGCGAAQTQMGPFYCPADEKVYIDLAFYKELKDRFGASGDFAQAYVIAHEFGHHVQNLLGISGKVEEAQQAHSGQARPLSVKLELQADCLAGVWGSSTQKILDPGDVNDALNAASAVGDDRIQKQATGRVNPETWTHGSAADRSRWFKTGFDSGTLDSCNTFGSR
ncbi:MAG TPA: neutral zinc metallopeptidase [Thermoanaerobaculia bacterium]|nr:neutral zinc metallopeptidase [Thermoanaerobaculia bacterium]